MSYFISGYVFISSNVSDCVIFQQFKQISEENGFYVLLDDDLKDNGDIQDMLKEQKKDNSKTINFVITTNKHDSTSDDIIHPQEYFPDKKKANQKVHEAILKVSNIFKNWLSCYFCKKIIFYITVGYANEFNKFEVFPNELQELLRSQYNPLKENWPTLEISIKK